MTPIKTYLQAGTMPPGWAVAKATTQAEADERVPGMLAVTKTIDLHDVVAGHDEYPITHRAIDLRGQTEAITLAAFLKHTGICNKCGHVGPLANVEGYSREWKPCGNQHCGYLVPAVCNVNLVVSGGTDTPIHPNWLRQTRDECQAAGVPWVFTGWGEWEPLQNFSSQFADQRIGVYTASTIIASDGHTSNCVTDMDGHSAPALFFRVGAARSGRMLDGRTWDG